MAPLCTWMSTVAKRLLSNGKGFLRRMQILEMVGADGNFHGFLADVQEAVVLPPVVAFALRPGPGIWKYVLVDTGNIDPAVSEISGLEFVRLKLQVDGTEVPGANYHLELPQLAQSDSTSNGWYQFANESLTARLFEDWTNADPLVGFLKNHSYKGQSLLVNDKAITGVDALQAALTTASEYLQSVDPETPHAEFDPVLRELGLDKGWGGNAKRAFHNVGLLLDILEGSHPDPAAVGEFLSAIPILFNVVILSPYDYFAQDDEMGYPHTATSWNIVYQVRTMEEELILRYKQQGLDEAVPNIMIVIPPLPHAVSSRSRQVSERLDNTQYANILRSPFWTEKGDGILGNWVSRFDMWPYLDIYTEDVAKDAVEELGEAWPKDMAKGGVGEFDDARPDLITAGTYSGGILAATLLIHRLDVNQANNVAGALDKSKSKQPEDHSHVSYPYSSYTQQAPMYSTIAGNVTYPKQLDVAGSAAAVGPTGVGVLKESLPTHVVSRGSGWTTVTPTTGRIWKVGTTATLLLLGSAAAGLAGLGPQSGAGDNLGVSLLFVMAQLGFLAIFNMLPQSQTLG